MSDITYGVVEEVHSGSGSNSQRITYGIAAYADIDDEETATVISHICDVTSDKAKAQDLVKKCNKLRLSLCHLKDIVEDFLSE